MQKDMHTHNDVSFVDLTMHAPTGFGLTNGDGSIVFGGAITSSPQAID
jgi:hypothetical protein